MNFAKLFTIALSVLVLTACHTVSGTVHGMGRDIQTVTGTSHHSSAHGKVVHKRTTTHTTTSSQQ